jgi:hypothetical protein
MASSAARLIVGCLASPDRAVNYEQALAFFDSANCLGGRVEAMDTGSAESGGYSPTNPLTMLELGRSHPEHAPMSRVE